MLYHLICMFMQNAVQETVLKSLSQISSKRTPQNKKKPKTAGTGQRHITTPTIWAVAPPTAWDEVHVSSIMSHHHHALDETNPRDTTGSKAST